MSVKLCTAIYLYISILFRKGIQVLQRGWAVVSPPREQQDMDQLYTLCHQH